MQMVGHFSSTFDETAPNWGNRPYLMGASRGWPRIVSGGLGGSPLNWTGKSPLSSENRGIPSTVGRHNARVTTYCHGVPIGAKKFSPIPTVMDLEIDFPKRPPKCIRAQNLLFGPECGAPVAREPPISLPSHSRFERVCLGPERTRAKKIRTEARPSPGTARRCTGAFRVGRVPLHQHDSEIGRIRAQFAHSEAWSGRGAPHSPGFSFWGSENIFIHMMHNRVGKYSEGSKKSSRAAFRPEYSRGSGRCTPVASEIFILNHRTVVPPMERSRSPPYWRGRNHQDSP